MRMLYNVNLIDAFKNSVKLMTKLMGSLGGRWGLS
jgi:hypothetical protein